MNLVNKIFRDSLFSAGSIGVQILRSILVIPLITKLLGTSDYGVWASIFAFIALVKTIGGVHLHGSLIRYRDAEDSPEQAYADVITLGALLGLISAAFVIGVGLAIDLQRLFENVPIDETAMVILSASIIFSQVIYTINFNFPRARGNIKRYEVINVSKTLAETVGLVTVFLLGYGIQAGLEALLAVNIGANVVLTGIIFFNHQVPLPDYENFARYIRYGLPMIPKELSGSILSDGDKYLLLYFVSPTAVGIYSVAYGMGTLLMQLTNILNPTLYPTIIDAWDAGRYEDIREVFWTIFKYYSIIAVPAAVGLSILGHSLLVIVSTGEIAGTGSEILPFLLLSFLVRGYGNPLEYILAAVEKTKLIGTSITVAAAVNLLLNVALIPRLEIYGAVVATVLSQIVFLALIYRYATASLQFPVPVVDIGKAAISAALMTAALYAIPVRLTPIPKIVVFSTVGATIYFTVMYAVDGISDDDVQYIKDTVS